MIILEYFSNRDLAIFIWSIPILILLLIKKDIQSSILKIIRFSTHSKVALIFGILITYVASVSYILWEIGFWDSSLLKATILWTFGSGIAGLFEYSKQRNVQNFFSIGMRSQLSVIIFVEYVATLKSFSLWFELISLPILTFIGLLNATSKKNKEHQNVQSILLWTMSLFGIYLLATGIYIVWTDQNFWTIATLKDFLLPILLSLSILPFFYLLVLFTTFETRLIGIKYQIKDEDLQKRAKYLAIWHYAFDLDGLDRWFHELQIAKVQSISELKMTFDIVRARRKIEKTSQKISLKLGWSPFDAMQFSDNECLKPKHYKQLWKNSPDWYANSNYLKLDEIMLGNQISYTINGTEKAATQLSLNLDVQNKPTQESALNFLVETLSTVSKNAKIYLAEDFLKKVKQGQDAKYQMDFVELEIIRSDWPDNKSFELTVNITHKNHKKSL